MKLYHAYPKLVNIVGTSFEDKTNYMAVAWHTYLSFDPPLYGIAIAEKRFTYQLLKKSEEFNCNFLPYEKIKIAHGIGRISGNDVDKIKALNIKTSSGVKIKTPYIKDSYAVIECKLHKIIKTGDHVFLIGKIVHIKYDKSKFTSEELLNTDAVTPILYLGSNTYLKVENYKIEKYPQEINLDEWL